MLLNKKMAKGSKDKPLVNRMQDDAEDLKDRTVNLGIPGDVHAAFRAYCERRSASQRGLAGRILTWYMHQPDIVTSAILGTDQNMEEAYAVALEELARAVRRGATANPPLSSADIASRIIGRVPAQTTRKGRTE